MSAFQRLFAAALTAALAVGAFTGVAHAAPVDDSISVHTDTAPVNVEVYPQGSSLIGPVTIDIGTVIVDAGDISVILDNVALLARLIGPIATN